MAEQKQTSDKENNRSAPAATDRPASKGVGPVEAVILSAAMGLAKLWNALTGDGVLAASFRQGADELGAALKAFPDSIQREESGTILNPTQGEIAAGREQSRDHGNFWIRSDLSSSRPPWPSEIAEKNRHQPGRDHGPGLDNGHDAGYSM